MFSTEYCQGSVSEGCLRKYLQRVRIENPPKAAAANGHWAYGVQAPLGFRGSQETVRAGRTGPYPHDGSLAVAGGPARVCAPGAHSYCSSRYCDLGQDDLERGSQNEICLVGVVDSGNRIADSR